MVRDPWGPGTLKGTQGTMGFGNLGSPKVGREGWWGGEGELGGGRMREWVGCEDETMCSEYRSNSNTVRFASLVRFSRS